MQTVSRQTDIFDDRATFDIKEIAHALSLICRFNGHTIRHYSVAEHSLLVASEIERCGHSVEAQLAGLLHDVAEAYIGDFVSPLKYQMSIGGVSVEWFEKDLRTRILSSLGLKDFFSDRSYADIVDMADVALLQAELRDLFAPSRNSKRARCRVPKDKPCWTMEVEFQFFGEYKRLTRECRRMRSCK